MAAACTAAICSQRRSLRRASTRMTVIRVVEGRAWRSAGSRWPPQTTRKCRSSACPRSTHHIGEALRTISRFSRVQHVKSMRPPLARSRRTSRAWSTGCGPRISASLTDASDRRASLPSWTRPEARVRDVAACPSALVRPLDVAGSGSSSRPMVILSPSCGLAREGSVWHNRRQSDRGLRS
jgi:hypothetical protein